MAKLTFENLDDFVDFVPLILGVVFKNSDMFDPDSLSADFYDDIEKKVLPAVRQYTRSVPEQRRKLKFFLSGLEGSSNTVITIKPDKKSNEQKYLTEGWKPMKETIKKYLEE